jgi:ubiquinone/menaquinone biosynthesis C-methylase UbiE
MENRFQKRPGANRGQYQAGRFEQTRTGNRRPDMPDPLDHMTRLERLRLFLSSNGVMWTVVYVVRQLFIRGWILTDRLRLFLEGKYRLPGVYLVQTQRPVWQSYDWRELGEEWTPSPEWKQSLIENVLLKYFHTGSTVLELGPGAGRWTEPLVRLADRVILVDFSSTAIETCRKRFSEFNNIEYCVNDGASLGFLPGGSVDFLWSLDVLWIVGPRETEQYVSEFARVLNANGIGIVSHSGKEGWRYGLGCVTTDIFHDMLRGQGLKIVDNFDSWRDGRTQHDLLTGTEITIFTK